MSCGAMTSLSVTWVKPEPSAFIAQIPVAVTLANQGPATLKSKAVSTVRVDSNVGDEVEVGAGVSEASSKEGCGVGVVSGRELHATAVSVTTAPVSAK